MAIAIGNFSVGEYNLGHKIVSSASGTFNFLVSFDTNSAAWIHCYDHIILSIWNSSFILGGRLSIGLWGAYRTVQDNFLTFVWIKAEFRTFAAWISVHSLAKSLVPYSHLSRVIQESMGQSILFNDDSNQYFKESSMIKKELYILSWGGGLFEFSNLLFRDVRSNRHSLLREETLYVLFLEAIGHNLITGIRSGHL